MFSMIALLAALLGVSSSGFAAADSGDRGWGIDPNGAPRAAATTSCGERGGMIDPNGCPANAAGASTDAGVQIDPEG
jgi:hypothetical protein